MALFIAVTLCGSSTYSPVALCIGAVHSFLVPFGITRLAVSTLAISHLREFVSVDAMSLISVNSGWAVIANAVDSLCYKAQVGWIAAAFISAQVIDLGVLACLNSSWERSNKPSIQDTMNALSSFIKRAEPIRRIKWTLPIPATRRLVNRYPAKQFCDCLSVHYKYVERLWHSEFYYGMTVLDA